MKKYTFIFALALFLFVTPAITIAINLGGNLADEAARGAGYSANTTETSFASLLGTVVKAVLSFAGVIFLILMVYAGYLWMTARGDDSQIEKAQTIIRSAVIGLIITVGAYSITAFVVPRIVEKTTGPGGGAADVGGQTGSCNVDVSAFSSISDKDIPNISEPDCRNECAIVARATVNCQYNSDNSCSWDTGSDSGPVTKVQCDNSCASAGSNNVTCNWTPLTN